MQRRINSIRSASRARVRENWGKQMTIAKSLIAVGLIIGLPGCAIKSISHGTAITQLEATSKITIGKTTRNEVLLNLGEPTKTMNNEKVYFYSWTRGSKVSVMGIGSGNAKANTLVVVFDDKDIVKDYRFSRGAVGSEVVD